MGRTSTFFKTRSVRLDILEADSRLAFTTSLSNDSNSCGRIVELSENLLEDTITSAGAIAATERRRNHATRTRMQVEVKRNIFALVALLWSVHNAETLVKIPP